MHETTDPNQIVAGLGVVVLLLAGLWRLIAWVREAAPQPDPWNAEVERALAEPETVEVCTHCLTPQPPTAWFCEHCGNAVGPYNNWMPYVYVFSIGEVLRNGVMDKMRSNAFIICGYLLLSANFFFAIIVRSYFASWLFVCLTFGVLLLYWFFLFKNLSRSRELNPDEQPEGI
jgi:hypothetical protein